MRYWMTGVLALLAAGPLPAEPLPVPTVRPVAVPARADAQLASLSPGLQAWVRAQARATLESSGPVDAGRIARSARARLAGQDFSNADIDALVLLVMAQAARDAEADLRDAMDAMQASRKEKEAMRAQAKGQKVQAAGLSTQVRAEYADASRPAAATCGGTPCQARAVLPASVQLTPVAPAGPGGSPPAEPADSMSEMSQQDQQQMQLLMDRKAKLEATLSEIMKKNSDTTSNLTSNLK